MSDPIASIILLTYNNLDYTRQCLDSIYAKTDGPDFEVVIVDNASRDETPAYLRSFAQATAVHANCHIFLNQENVGFSAGNNQGARAAKGQYLVFLNNDTIVTRGWLNGLLKPLADPAVGMTGPVTNSSGNESRILVDYTDLADLDAFAARYAQEHAGQAQSLSMLPFLCVALRREVWEQIGPLDDRFGMGMFEDDDYGVRLHQAGYKIVCVEDVFIHHFGSASFSRLPSLAYAKLFRQNRAKFEEKWGQKWQPHTVRPELLPSLFDEQIEANLFQVETIGRLEGEIKRLNEQLTLLQADHYRIKTELTELYASNGWALLQAFLRFRRFLIPEKSRREKVLKEVLSLVRGLKPRRLGESWQRIRASLRSSKQATEFTPAAEQPVVMQAAPSASDAAPALGDSPWIPDGFPWPLVSVVLPVYNHADLLEAAAHSILNGTYANLELLLLDDGSTDAIEPVLNRLRANPRVHIYRQPNQKLPRALTHALAFVRGEFVTWTSADNLFAPDAIERMVKGLLTNPDAALVYADVQVIDEDGNPLTDNSYRPQNVDTHRKSVIRLHRSAAPLGSELDNYINACFLFRRAGLLALEGHYADDLRGFEDYDFWLRLQKCGRFHHLQNDEPLYAYRVHKRTMSHELITGQLQAHLARGQQMLAYEAQRRQFATQRWMLTPDKFLPGRDTHWLEEIAAALPVDCQPASGGFSARQASDSSDAAQPKNLRFVPGMAACEDAIFVRVHPTEWELAWKSPYTGDEKTLLFWKGLTLDPLALKARELVHHRWLLPAAVGTRPVIGCHLGLADFPLDLAATRQVIASNPWAFFAFVDLTDRDSPQRGQELADGLENAAYLGVQPPGAPYQLYSAFDLLWLPPVTGDLPARFYRVALTLAYATARPLLVPQHSGLIAAPYQLTYLPENASLRFAGAALVNGSQMDTVVLDRYLATWTPAASLQAVLDHANAIAQEMALPRPDFGIPPPAESAPRPWQPAHSDAPLKCLFAVDSLDTGGLEEIVGTLAQHLPEYGIETAVLCGASGGVVAERLQASGVRVHIVGDDRSAVQRILQAEQPDVINSQYLHLHYLEALGNSGIPIIETIQNTYVWFDAWRWQQERLRSRYFTRAVAVSDLARRYYLHRNPDFNPAWLDVIPNGADPQRVAVMDFAAARQQLGIPADAFVFLSLASYDERKNQLGLLTAFDRVAQQFPQAYLLCAGGAATSPYHQSVVDARAALRNRERIMLEGFRQDTSLLLSAADTFIINSVYEGWSVAATEALFAGLPLIHTDCGSGRELVGPAGERGILIPNPAGSPIDLRWADIETLRGKTIHHNTEELVQAMKQMASQADVWRVRRAALRTETQELFGVEKMFERYTCLFRQVSGA